MQVPPLRYVLIEGLPTVSLGVRVGRGRRPATLNRFIEILAEELQRTPSLRPMQKGELRERPSGLFSRKARSTNGPRILSSAHSILSAANRLPRTDCSTSPATICHHSVSHQSARRAWRTLSVD